MAVPPTDAMIASPGLMSLAALLSWLLPVAAPEVAAGAWLEAAGCVGVVWPVLSAGAVLSLLLLLQLARAAAPGAANSARMTSRRAGQVVDSAEEVDGSDIGLVYVAWGAAADKKCAVRQ